MNKKFGMKNSEMKFMVDAMFGRLARWLRMSGYDALYEKDASDAKMIEAAKKEGRIIITRDRNLYQKANREGAKIIFLAGRDFLTNLKLLEAEHGLEFKAEPELARCAICNGELEKISADEAGKKMSNFELPSGELWKCSKCGKIYWKGAHWKNIESTVKKIKGDK